MKKTVWLCVFLLTACSSSPPEAPKVDWGKKGYPMNTQLMIWTPTQTIIKSDEVNEKWQKQIDNFIPENRLYDDAVFYAIAHANKIIIEVNGGNEFLKTKTWLQAHGANAVIEYQSKPNWLKNSTTIYLIRE
ncbi:conjugal transfer protein [Providencia rettgeri]